MLRPVVTLAAVGAVGILLWNLLLGFLLPFVVGFFALAIKIVFWAALIAIAIWIFKRLTRESPSLV